jgi:thiamine-monophosphate kinase
LGLIAQIRARANPSAGQYGREGLRLGIGDDCALLRLRRGEELAVTTDLSIAGRHFRLDWHPPEAVGHRVLARGLSDLAAMGARPVAAFLSLGLPRELVDGGGRRSFPWSPNARDQGHPGIRAGNGTRSASWADRFLDGFFALAEAYNTPLAGGDLAESPVALADIVLVGAVPRGKALLRSSARAGDMLYVTGSLGGSVAGLACLAELAGTGKRVRAGVTRKDMAQVQNLRIPKDLEAVLTPHLHPQPRIAQGQWLARRGLATAALDISDGLSTDLAHLCDESGVCAELDAAGLPLHAGTTLAQALHGGEDYEMLFTAPPSTRVPRAIAGVPVTRIGRMLRRRAGKPQMVLITERGREPLQPKGWEHFS